MRHMMMLATFCLILSGLLAGKSGAIDHSRKIVFDMPPAEALKYFGEMPGSGLSQAELQTLTSFRFTTDTAKVLAVLVDWSDRPGTHSRETFDSLLFSRNTYPSGSLADYFDEVSYGKFQIVGDVIDWHNAGTYSNTFNFETLFESLDSLLDYSQYDWNGDGFIDGLVYIRSGTGTEPT